MKGPGSELWAASHRCLQTLNLNQPLYFDILYYCVLEKVQIFLE